MSYVQYGKRRINFEIKRGNRKKTVAIHVNPMAPITVLSPRCLDEEKIRMVLLRKARWIIEKQEQIKKIRNSDSVKQFVSGESFPYLGRYYRLKVMKSIVETEEKCTLVGGRLVVEVNGKSDSENGLTAIKKALMDWYIQHAEDKIGERASRFARLIGRWPTSVKIKNQERRWGSCSRNGEIRYNWKIIMAPPSVIDYVVTHELCHLFFTHHSTHFWRKVQSIIPDYKKRRDWLKENSLLINAMS